MKETHDQAQTQIRGFVAYFDILGFSELIRMSDDFSLKIKTYNEILQDALKKENRRNLDYVFFSDSVIINSKTDVLLDLLDISLAVSEISYRLCIELELTLSGCISHGVFTKLSDDVGNVMITGTPILDAIHYENQQNWIGTMFSPKIIRNFREITRLSQFDHEEIRKYRRREMNK